MEDAATLRFLTDALQCQVEAGLRWLEADALVELCLLALVGPPLGLSALAYARASRTSSARCS